MGLEIFLYKVKKMTDEEIKTIEGKNVRDIIEHHLFVDINDYHDDEDLKKAEQLIKFCKKVKLKKFVKESNIEHEIDFECYACIGEYLAYFFNEYDLKDAVYEHQQEKNIFIDNITYSKVDNDIFDLVEKHVEKGHGRIEEAFKKEELKEDEAIFYYEWY